MEICFCNLSAKKHSKNEFKSFPKIFTDICGQHFVVREGPVSQLVEWILKDGRRREATQTTWTQVKYSQPCTKADRYIQPFTKQTGIFNPAQKQTEIFNPAQKQTEIFNPVK